jgi:hypothetical protein
LFCQQLELDWDSPSSVIWWNATVETFPWKARAFPDKEVPSPLRFPFTNRKNDFLEVITAPEQL